MRLRPNAAPLIALTAATALALAGCSLTDDPEAEQPAPTTSTPTKSHPKPGSSTGTSHPTSAPTSGQSEGDGDGEDDDTPATAGGGICGELEAAEVGRILGGSTRGAALPGGGCGFTLTAAKGPSSTFVEKSFAKTSGGMAGAKTEATSSVEGEPRDLGGIGDAAFVVTGTAFGEPAVQGAGAVRVGSRLIYVNVNQNTGMTASAVEALMIKLLKLAAINAA